MSSPEDLEDRLTSLERQVSRLQEQTALASSDAAAARVLASGADRDVSEVRAELRAHTTVLNALRQTQLEQGQAILALDRRLDGKVGALAATTAQGSASVDAGMAEIVRLLSTLAPPDEAGAT